MKTIAFWFGVLAAIPGSAQQPADTAGGPTLAEIARAKQNPVSGLRTVYFQDVIAPYGDGAANGFSVQPVWPFRIGEDWKLITYTIVPVQWLPTSEGGVPKAGGLGNILFNGYFRPAKASGPLVWGIGPAMQLPTRTDAGLGSSALCLGPAALLYLNAGVVGGGLVLQNFWSLGATGTNRVNLFSGQYILFYNFSPAFYLESNATITASWVADAAQRWTVPIGGGPGFNFQIGKSKYFYSAAVQGFYNAARPEPVGSWSVILQFQIIFGQ